MAQNIELKLKLKDFANIRELLAENNIKITETLNQRDIYYRNENGLLKLRIYPDRGELIFYQRDESGKDRISNYHILNVNSVEAEKFFNELFVVETEVVKKRDLYLYKNTRIHLDTVEQLGKFLELETVVNDSTDKGIEEFSEVVDLLELDTSRQIKSSYRTLLLNQ